MDWRVALSTCTRKIASSHWKKFIHTRTVAAHPPKKTQNGSRWSEAILKFLALQHLPAILPLKPVHALGGRCCVGVVDGRGRDPGGRCTTRRLRSAGSQGVHSTGCVEMGFSSSELNVWDDFGIIQVWHCIFGKTFFNIQVQTRIVPSQKVRPNSNYSKVFLTIQGQT